MTAVACVRILGVPTLVGDVVLTSGGKRLDGGGGKVYRITPNVALGWSGNTELAIPALRYLFYALGDRIATIQALEAAFDRLDELRGRAGLSLDLTGWVVTPDGEKAIRWTTTHRPPLFDDEEHAIGSGGVLKEMLAPPKISTSTTHGYDVVPMKAISGFLQARGEENRPLLEQAVRDALERARAAQYVSLPPF